MVVVERGFVVEKRRVERIARDVFEKSGLEMNARR